MESMKGGSGQCLIMIESTISSLRYTSSVQKKKDSEREEPKDFRERKQIATTRMFRFLKKVGKYDPRFSSSPSFLNILPYFSSHLFRSSV